MPSPRPHSPAALTVPSSLDALRQAFGFDDIKRKLDGIEAILSEMQTDNRPEWYSIRQVAEKRGKSVRTIQRHIAAGKLPVTERYGERMIHRDHV